MWCDQADQSKVDSSLPLLLPTLYGQLPTEDVFQCPSPVLCGRLLTTSAHSVPAVAWVPSTEV